MKISVTLASVVLLGATLGACSGSGGDETSKAGGSYCDDIAAAKPVFEDLAAGDLAQLEKGFTTFHRLAAEAPDDLADEWKTLDGAATSVETQLKKAGLKFSDLAGIQNGKLPDGVDPGKITAFAAELQKLNNPEFATARTAIAEQAQDSCKVKLGSL